MGEETCLERLKTWLAMLPIALAYRLIWLAAKTGHHAPLGVYRVMWENYFDLPPLDEVSEDA